MKPPVLGIFVGGQANRMGGLPKGLLKAPGTELTLVKALATRFSELDASASVLLVGKHPDYGHLPFRTLEDAPPGIGPIGGLAALLTYAREHMPMSPVVTVGCDMPFVTTPLFEKLLRAPSANAVAPKLQDHWQPMFCRYNAEAALPVVQESIAQGKRRLFRVLEALNAAQLQLTETEATLLRDWDSQADIARDLKS